MSPTLLQTVVPLEWAVCNQCLSKYGQIQPSSELSLNREKCSYLRSKIKKHWNREFFFLTIFWIPPPLKKILGGGLCKFNPFKIRIENGVANLSGNVIEGSDPNPEKSHQGSKTWYRNSSSSQLLQPSCIDYSIPSSNLQVWKNLQLYYFSCPNHFHCQSFPILSLDNTLLHTHVWRTRETRTNFQTLGVKKVFGGWHILEGRGVS